MFVIWLSGESFELVNVVKLFFTWILLVTFSSGLGMIFMVIGKTFPEMEKFLPIMLKPLYFVSCIMYPLHSIPKEYWPYLTWNPITHIVELSRQSVIPNYISDGTSLTYLAIATLVTLFIGLALYRHQEEAMLTS